MRTLPTIVALPALALLITACGTGTRQRENWQFTIAPMAHHVSVADESNNNTGLAVQVGVQVPESWWSRARLTPFFDIVTDAAVGAAGEDDIAFSTSSIGIQLQPEGTVDGFSVVTRAAWGWLHTAETQQGQILTNYSGRGFTVGGGLRRPLRGGTGAELGVAYTRGSFSNAQTENLTTNVYTDKAAVSVGHNAWRIALGIFF